MKITYYLEVISSWCHWAEPAWKEMKQSLATRAEFDWKIALMPAEAYPVSKQQCEWFYRRSGSIVRSPYMLSSGWLVPEVKQYVVPNYVAQAAKLMGITDDTVRLALATAAVRKGKKVGSWPVAIEIAANASSLAPSELEKLAKSLVVKNLCEKTTAEFQSLQVTQRPTFLIENSIGDRVVFSGTVKIKPLMAAAEALMSDEDAYISWKAHFGDPPKH